MIKKIEAYELWCDGCGKAFGELLTSKEGAEIIVKVSSLWVKIGDKHYHSACAPGGEDGH